MVCKSIIKNFHHHQNCKRHALQFSKPSYGCSGLWLSAFTLHKCAEARRCSFLGTAWSCYFCLNLVTGVISELATRSTATSWCCVFEVCAMDYSCYGRRTLNCSSKHPYIVTSQATNYKTRKSGVNFPTNLTVNIYDHQVTGSTIYWASSTTHRWKTIHCSIVSHRSVQSDSIWSYFS